MEHPSFRRAPGRGIRSLPGLSFAGCALIIAGCAMEHEPQGNPATVPIPPVAFEALYVVNGGSNSLSVFNAATGDLAGTITIRNASFPHHADLSPDSASLAVAVPGIDLSAGHGAGGHRGHGTVGALLLLDARTGETKAARRFPGPNHNAAFSPDGKEIWTSQMTSPGKVLVLDAATLNTLKTLEVGAMPAEVTFTVDGRYAFVANGGSATVSVFDAASKELVKTLGVGQNPVGAWPGNDTVMYVDNEESRTLTVVHGRTLEVLRTQALGFTPGMAATGPDGALWVTDADNGKVVLFAAADSVKTGEIATGAGAHGIAFSRDGKTAFVSNQSAGTVSVIDIAGKQVTKSLAVGSKPNGLVIR